MLSWTHASACHWSQNECAMAQKRCREVLSCKTERAALGSLAYSALSSGLHSCARLAQKCAPALHWGNIGPSAVFRGRPAAERLRSWTPESQPQSELSLAVRSAKYPRAAHVYFLYGFIRSQNLSKLLDQGKKFSFTTISTFFKPFLCIFLSDILSSLLKNWG